MTANMIFVRKSVAARHYCCCPIGSIAVIATAKCAVTSERDASEDAKEGVTMMNDTMRDLTAEELSSVSGGSGTINTPRRLRLFHQLPQSL
jgi:hypothetical protein